MPKKKQSQPGFIVSVEREAKIRNIIDGNEMLLDRHLLACQFDDGAAVEFARAFYSYIKKELVLGYPRLNRAAMPCDYDHQLLGLLSVAIGGEAVRRAVMALDPKIILMATREMVFLEAGNGQALKIASFLLNTNIKGQRLQNLGVRGLRGNTVRRMRKELKVRVSQIIEGSSVANKNTDGIDDINFFIGQYAKRRFLIDLQNDEGLSAKAQAVFDLLSEVHSHYSEEDEDVCKGCAWFSSDAKHASLPFVLSGFPCGMRQCAFKRYVKEVVDVFATQIGVKSDESGSGVQQKTLTFDARHLDALNACVELASNYGLYPYDLLVVPSANMLCQGKELHLPKPNSFVPKSRRLGELFRGEMVTFLKDAFQAKKKRDTYRGYREDNLRRIVGLWVWDRLFESGTDAPTSFHEKIKSLFDEDWYKETYLGDNTARQLARVKNKRLDVKAIVEQHRNYYVTVDQEIRHGRLLSERLAKKLKKDVSLTGEE